MSTIVSWYTVNTPYEEVLNHYLLPSVERLNLDHKIYPVRSLKDWTKNTNQKPDIALKALDEIDDDILLVDADCRIHVAPTLLDRIPPQYDMGVFYLDWQTWYRKGYPKKELCSGTLFFRHTKGCREVIEAWKAEGNKTGLPDQLNLDAVLKLFPHVNVYVLPLEYCWINSLPTGEKPHIKRPENVVVEHFQMSRRLRSIQ